ncbi:Poly [ADP-ribose] polymerase [Blattella germanica]|nr:Poly [ADP-ribose] polymerase [Blattella germanica]
MSDDLPYRAEYAKSGRASCKGCKSPIAKDVLRLAVMVQSPMFDGKTPHWYHFMCFFGRQRPKTIGDISHFESLRWEDQEKIKAKIESGGVGGDVVDGGGKGKGKKRGATNNVALKDFTVQYAKSGRSTCKGCEEKILKDEVRISKKDFESEGAKMYGGQDRWHHVECFAKLRDELEFWESGEDLPGIKTLKKEDQAMVKQNLPKVDKKIKSETDGPSPPKKSKPSKEEEEVKEQSKLMYKIRDQLKKHLSKKDLQYLLESNDQEIPVGEDKLLDRLADIMTFGVLTPCKECKGGQFVYRSGVGYQCMGDLTEWTKCQNKTLEPKRKPFKVPTELTEEFDFLKKYKFVPRKRTILLHAPSATATSSSQSNGDPIKSMPKVQRAGPPLKNMQFAILGKTTKSRDELKKEIQKLGGKVVTQISDKLAAVISTPTEVEKMNKKMEEVKTCDIQVVPEDYLDEAKDGSAILLITKKSICSWGSDPQKRIVVDTVDSGSKKSKSGSMYTKSMPSKVKLKLKGGATVDPDSGLDDVAHVYRRNEEIFNAVLGVTDIQGGKNSYYKFWLFRAWGRIGTTIGGNKLENMDTVHEAIQNFKSLYEEKTGNIWEDRKHFQKVPGRLYPIDLDYGQDEDIIPKAGDDSINSKLAKPVQELVSLLFDVDTMKKVMMEFEIMPIDIELFMLQLDLQKMPLGKLSKKQIQHAYSVLTELQGMVKKGGSESRFLDASNRFYTLIPHDFGVDNPPLLNNEEIIKQKLDMLESLMEIEIAYNMLKTKSEGDDEMHPIDVHYKKLNTSIEVLDKKSVEFDLLQKYVQNTHAKTHGHYDLEILEVFKVKRQGEDKRFKPFKKLHNRKLLWHGSRLTNFAGILSQGIYFADMVSKSANYCCTSKNNPVGLMLLCEVALGNMYERPHADYIEKLPKDKHSTKGLGRTEPDPSEIHKTKDGVEIPLGKGVECRQKSLSLLYNEYPFLTSRLN